MSHTDPPTLGRLVPVPRREVSAHEALDIRPWLLHHPKYWERTCGWTWSWSRLNTLWVDSHWI